MPERKTNNTQKIQKRQIDKEKKNTRKILQLKFSPPYVNHSWNFWMSIRTQGRTAAIIIIRWEVKVIKWQRTAAYSGVNPQTKQN